MEKENEMQLRKNELAIISLLSGMIRDYKKTETLNDVSNLICKTSDDILKIFDFMNTICPSCLNNDRIEPLENTHRCYRCNNEWNYLK